MLLPHKSLAPITNPFNSFLIEKKLTNVDEKFLQLVSLAEDLPRTKVVESRKNYWKGVCRSLIFRFPDDLEILKIGNKIQVKSASRYGGGDLGVNGTRVGKLLTDLEKLNS